MAFNKVERRGEEMGAAAQQGRAVALADVPLLTKSSLQMIVHVAIANDHWYTVSQLLHVAITADQATADQATADHAHGWLVEEYLPGGVTPLICAVRHGSVRTSAGLLAAKANVDFGDVICQPPLHHAVQLGQTGVAKLLLDAKATVTAMNSTWTPLHYTAITGDAHMTQMVLDVDPSVHAIVLRLKGGNRVAPLWLAAAKGHADVVAVLARTKADVECANDTGMLPLAVAANQGHEAVVKVLLTAAADVNATDRVSNQTPIMLASARGCGAVVRVLLRAKADVNCTDFADRTALDLAVERGHKHVAALLRRIDEAHASRKHVAALLRRMDAAQERCAAAQDRCAAALLRRMDAAQEPCAAAQERCAAAQERCAAALLRHADAQEPCADGW